MELFKSYMCVLLLFVLISPDLKADKKYFARSYTSYTLPANAVELELWQTGRFNKGLGQYYRWQPRFEVEYGVTDRLTVSMYFNFNQVKSKDNSYVPKSFELSTTSFEFRYRLTNPGEYFVDPALYFEFGFGGDKVEYEPKILLTKRFDQFISVVNIISEIERQSFKDETESKFEITAGIAYELSKNLSLGFEFRNHHNFEGVYNSKVNSASFIGPTFSLQSDKMYFVLSWLVQISGSSANAGSLDLIGHEKYEVRTILGIEL